MLPEQINLATNLKDLRQERGLSLQKMGDQVGLSKVHIWEIEQGRSINPGLVSLLAISKFFDVSVDYLLTKNI